MALRLYRSLVGNLRRHLGGFIRFSRFYGHYVTHSTVRETRSLNYENRKQNGDDFPGKNKTDSQRSESLNSESLNLDVSLFSDK